MKNKHYINIDDEANRELNETAHPAVTEAIRSNPMEEVILDMDVRTTMDSLPMPERSICRMLLEGYTQQEISKELKISPATLTQKHLPFIRQRFLDYGFEKHELNF